MRFSTIPPLPPGPVKVPDRADRDRVMGEYMNAWSRVENLTRLAIQQMLEIDDLAMRAISAAMTTRSTIDLFLAAAKLTLNKAGISKVRKLYDSLIDRNRRRNNIVHGRWECHVYNPSTGDAEWLLRYNSIDLEITALPHSDPKVAGLYSFTVSELSQTTTHAERMVVALAKFLAEIPALRLPAPQSGE